jgi:hypothetical protein
VLALLSEFKAYFVGAGVVLTLFAGLYLGGAFRKPDIIQDNIYSRMEDVKHIRHLELV